MITQFDISVEDSVTRNHTGVPCVITVFTLLVTHVLISTMLTTSSRYVGYQSFLVRIIETTETKWIEGG